MPLVTDFKYREDGSLEHITFKGLDGCESAQTLKGALELLKLENLKRTFQQRVRIGEFDNVSDEVYCRVVSTVESIAELWRYPDAPEGESTQSEMNVLMLLANAIELLSRQHAVINGQDAGYGADLGK